MISMALQKKILFTYGLFFLTMAFYSCNEKKENPQPTSTQEIINADLAFSDMCRQVGMKKAFLQYIDNEGTLLRPDHFPIIGADAINYISQLSDTAYTLSWRPSNAEIAASGDLGYTFGIFKLQLPDTTFSGTYVNIWKKEKDGECKFVLNSDNPGTG